MKSENLETEIISESENDLIIAQRKEVEDNKFWAYIMLFSVIFIWGVNFPIIKMVLKEIPPLAFNAIRFGLGSVVISILLFIIEGWKTIPLKDWLGIVLLGFITNLLYQLAFINGIAITHAGIASILTSTSPLWTAFLAWIFKIEKISKWVIYGIILAFSGIIVMVIGGGKSLEVGNNLMGELLILTASCLWAVGTLVSKKLLEKYSPLRITAFSMFIGSIGIVIAGYPQFSSHNWSTVSDFVWLLILLTTIFPIVFGYVFWSTAVKHIGATKTSTFGNLVPVIAFISAYMILDETVSSFQILGAGIIFTGIWISRKR
jgi:drug/metabolite transporter (DMT)-like permease